MITYNPDVSGGLLSNNGYIDDATNAKGLLNLQFEDTLSDDDDVEQLAWWSALEEADMEFLEREFLFGLPFNENALNVCLVCRNPMNGDFRCDVCGQRSDMPLPSNSFVIHF